jgi:hypothetical protein
MNTRAFLGCGEQKNFVAPVEKQAKVIQPAASSYTD